jgi:hypothetical protein
MVLLAKEIQCILYHSFVIRTTLTRRSDGKPRTIETTYVWDAHDRVYLSGFPGKRDWVASMNSNPKVILHTVERRENGESYDIPAIVHVLKDRAERIPFLLAFIERWVRRGGQSLFLIKCALILIQLNRKLGLPWWGPFYLVRRLLDKMPCVEITFIGDPTTRANGPPPIS